MAASIIHLCSMPACFHNSCISLKLLCLQPWSSLSACHFHLRFAPRTLWETTRSSQDGDLNSSVSIRKETNETLQFRSFLFLRCALLQMVHRALTYSSYRSLWSVRRSAWMPSRSSAQPTLMIVSCVQGTLRVGRMLARSVASIGNFK
jgi:hypothetical protein